MELGVIAGLVPEHLVFQLVGGGGVADHQTFIILGTLVHELAEHFKGWKHTCIILIDTTAVTENVLTKNEDKIYVRAEIRSNTEGVLHSDHGG